MSDVESNPQLTVEERRVLEALAQVDAAGAKVASLSEPAGRPIRTRIALQKLIARNWVDESIPKAGDSQYEINGAGRNAARAIGIVAPTGAEPLPPISAAGIEAHSISREIFRLREHPIGFPTAGLSVKEQLVGLVFEQHSADPNRWFHAKDLANALGLTPDQMAKVLFIARRERLIANPRTTSQRQTQGLVVIGDQGLELGRHARVSDAVHERIAPVEAVAPLISNSRSIRTQLERVLARYRHGFVPLELARVVAGSDGVIYKMVLEMVEPEYVKRGDLRQALDDLRSQHDWHVTDLGRSTFAERWRDDPLTDAETDALENAAGGKLQGALRASRVPLTELYPASSARPTASHDGVGL